MTTVMSGYNNQQCYVFSHVLRGFQSVLCLHFTQYLFRKLYIIYLKLIFHDTQFVFKVLLILIFIEDVQYFHSISFFKMNNFLTGMFCTDIISLSQIQIQKPTAHKRFYFLNLLRVLRITYIHIISFQPAHKQAQ